jgi:hypothetical protein
VAVTIRREVNLINEIVGSSSASASVYPGGNQAMVKIDADDYSGTVTAYFEAIVKNAEVSDDRVINIRRGSVPGTVGTNITNEEITVPASTTTWTRIRGGGFSLDSTLIYYNIIVPLTTNNDDVQLLAARIVIIQTVADATDLIKSVGQFEIGARESGLTTGSSRPLTNPKFFQYTDANWATGAGAAGCSQVDWYASVVYSGDAMTTGLAAYVERTSDFSAWTVCDTIFTGGAATEPLYVETILSTPMQDAHWYRILFGGGKEGMDIYSAHLIAKQQGSTANPLLKTEDSYLMVNKVFGSTGILEYLTYFDPTTAEWEGVANEYYHQMDNMYNQQPDNPEMVLVNEGSTVAETGSSVGNAEASTGTKMAHVGSSMTLDTAASTLAPYVREN